MTTNFLSVEALKERRSRRFWVMFVLAFFSLDLVIAIVAISMAASDPSFRPMPDYGDRSVTWEVHRQDQLRSERLGWSVSISGVEPHRQAIDFIVIDRNGFPITNAAGSANAYHLTRVAEQQHASLEEVEPGRYQARIDCHRPGLWKIEFRLTRKSIQTSNDPESDDAFVYESTIDLPLTSLMKIEPTALAAGSEIHTIPEAEPEASAYDSLNSTHSSGQYKGDL